MDHSEREEAAEAIRPLRLEASRHQHQQAGSGGGDVPAPRRFEAALEDLLSEVGAHRSRSASKNLLTAANAVYIHCH